VDEDQVAGHGYVTLVGGKVVEGPVELGQEVVALHPLTPPVGPDLGHHLLDPVHGLALEPLARGGGQKRPGRADEGLGAVEPVEQRDQSLQIGG
jgi:hypothetical protein